MVKGKTNYIYEQRNEVGEVVKIGKTTRPKSRLLNLNNDGYKGHTLKIICVFEDIESGFINKYLEEGYELPLNKQRYKDGENGWKVGDIIKLKKPII